MSNIKLKYPLYLIGLLFIYSFGRVYFNSTDYLSTWPEPIYNFETNVKSEIGFELGRKLFYDPSLSRDGTISCASCHLQYTGFAHVDHNVSHGIEGRKGTRNAPALINLIWNESFHWDGGVNHLEVQAINPIEHPNEMDNSLSNVIEYVNADRDYRSMFYDFSGDSTANSKSFLKAITQFVGSLISQNSKYDQYMRGEISLTDQELNGLSLFNQNCNKCHTAPLFMSNQFVSNGLPVDPVFNDLGRYNITKNPKDSFQFKVPTLRNIEYTFPYMHDGRFKKLSEVIEHYNSGVERSYTPHDQSLNDIDLSDEDQKDLISFLKTLTDKEFLYNPRLGFPRN